MPVYNNDTLSRAKKALSAPNSGAVVPANKSGRNDVIALARAAVQRPAMNFAAPADAVAPVEEQKGTALIARVREAAAKPVPVRPVVKIPDPPHGPGPAKAGVETPVPVEAPASVPATQIVPVEIAPGQTTPVEVPPANAGGAQQPIVVNVNVVNENRGWWGPYWYASCPRWTCPHRHGLPCHRWLCW